MSFVSVLGFSNRLGLLRLSGKRLPSIICQPCPSNARGFSRSLQTDEIFRNHHFLRGRRLVSTEAGAHIPDASTINSTVDIAIPPEVSSDVAANLTSTVMSHVPVALQYGDMAALGLAGWSPAGIVRWSLEVINVATGLPWFWTIVVGSIFWRALLVPPSIKSLQNSARLLPLQPKILQNQKEMDSLRKSGDRLALQKHALKLRKLYKDAGVSLGAASLLPLLPIPVSLGMFFGVKSMCQLPVPQLMNSGLGILPDLTVPDPYMILPIALCAIANVQIKVGSTELNLSLNPSMGHLMNGFRLLSVVGIWFMSALPSGLMVALITTSLAMITQSLILQRPSVRKALDIPIVPVEVQGKLPTPTETVQYFISSLRRKVDEAKIAQQQHKRKL